MRKAKKMRRKNRKCSPAASRCARRRVLSMALLLALCFNLPMAPGLEAREKKKGRITPQALLYGSVFQESGFSLKGARVVVTNAERPREKLEAKTDMQGEFAVRVPAGKGNYIVEISAEGFTSASKTVEITGDEHIDLTFHLSPLPK